MRDSVRLYIAGQLADLDERSVILLNYTAEELAAPTTVLTSYSRQIALPATRANDTIFQQSWRMDRVPGPSGWTPVQRLPFRLLSGTGELLEAGYARLERIEIAGGAAHRYSVILFGQLGAVLHRLTYGGPDDERKLSLADLPYDYDLGFTIDAATVARAWDALENDTPGKWQSINFAPAYNGIPSNNFDADKAVAVLSDIGLPASYTDPSSGKTYTAIGGRSVVSLSREHTELDVKDLRSYLQRPVIRWRSVVKAMQDYLSGNGITLDLDPTFFSDDNPYWDKSWITLPLIDTLTLEGGRSVSVPGILGDTDFATSLALLFGPAGMPIGSGPSTVTVTPELYVDLPGAGTRYLGDGSHRSAVLLQLIAYDASDQVIAQSNIQVYQGSSDGTTVAASTLAAMGTLSGTVDPTVRTVTVEDGTFTGLESIAVTAQTPASLRLMVEVVAIAGSDPLTFYDAEGTAITAAGETPFTAGGQTVTEATTGAVARSGASITQALLLGGTHTPADYLLSFAQMFGLHFLFDRGTQTVRLVTRNTLYADGAVTDIDALIDRDGGIAVEPVTFDARFYEFTNPAEGLYVDYYKTVFGEDYGQKRLNTSYEFNADHRQMLDGTAFRGAAEVLERRKYFIDITEDGETVPAPFVEAGNTYLLWTSDGETSEREIQCPTNAAMIDYFNPDLPTYDALAKVQLHGEDDAPIAGTDVLLFFCGMFTGYSGLRLTDDTTEMATLNNNNPCWLLTGGQPVASVPRFGRYYRADEHVHDSLDMGTPVEVDIPGLDLPDGACIYRRAWDAYLQDRYDASTRAVRCRVDLRRFQVCGDLLRRFWHFDNSLWVLNAISDYDPASDALTECEFVKVQDKDAYRTGQDYDEWNPLSPYTLAVSPLSVNFPAGGGTVQLTIYGDDAWEITGLPNWITASQTSGGVRGTYTSTVVTLSAPSSQSSLSGHFYVRGEGGSRITVPVTQEAATYTYTLEVVEGHYFDASGGSWTPTLIGTTYLNGVQTDRRVVTAADGVVYTGKTGDNYNQLSWYGLQITAEDLGTNVRPELSATVRANWHGASVPIVITQGENTKHLVSTSTGHSATIAIGSYQTSGTTVAAAGADSAALTVTGYEGTVYTYSWDSGATSTESDGAPWSGYTVTVEGPGASIADGRVFWASRGTAAGQARSATVKVWDGSTLLASATTTQAANAVESTGPVTAVITHSDYATSGTQIADHRGDICTLTTQASYTATYTSGATATVTDGSYPVTYEITSGSGCLINGSQAVWSANPDTSNRVVTVRALSIADGSAVASTFLEQQARVWLTIDGDEQTHTWAADPEGQTRNFTVISNSAVTLGTTYNVAAAALNLIETQADGTRVYTLTVTMGASADSARAAYVDLETSDDTYDGRLAITQEARYVAPQYVNITVGSGFTGILSALRIITVQGTYTMADVYVNEGELSVTQQAVLEAVGITTSNRFRNFSQFPDIYGTIRVECDYGGQTFSSSSASIGSATGDMSFSLSGVPSPSVGVYLASSGGSPVTTISMPAGVDSLTVYIHCTEAWLAAFLAIRQDPWISITPASGSGGISSARVAAVIACGQQTSDRTVTLQVASLNGYANTFVTVNKANDILSVAYEVDDTSPDGFVTAQSSDGQGLTGTAYSTSGWYLEIEITNDSTQEHDYWCGDGDDDSVVLWSDTLAAGETVSFRLGYTEIASVGGRIGIFEQ